MLDRLRLKLTANCFCPLHWYERYVETVKGDDPWDIFNLHPCSSVEYTQLEQVCATRTSMRNIYKFSFFSCFTTYTACLYLWLCIKPLNILQFIVNIKRWHLKNTA
jgi:hypothetical protein